MLVITRLTNETITIDTADGLIVVMLVEARQGRARIGVKAPAHVAVDRTEVRQRILAEQKAKGST